MIAGDAPDCYNTFLEDYRQAENDTELLATNIVSDGTNP